MGDWEVRASGSVMSEQRQDERRRLRWPQVVLRLTDAGAVGAQALAGECVRLARPLLAADAAALIRWQDGRPTVLAADGELTVGLDPRPAEGAGWAGSQPVAARSVDPRTDLVVTRSAPIGFTDDDLESLRALTAVVGMAGGHPQSHVLLRGLATRVVASLQMDEVLVSSADAVSRLLQAEIAGVLMLNSSGTDLEMRCAVGNTELDTAHLRVRVGQGLAGRVVASGQAERIDDYSTDQRSAPEFLALSDMEGTCSAIAVPLRSAGRITGALCAWRRRRSPFTDEDERVLAAVAELCGAGIHNAAAYEALERRADETELARMAADEKARGAQQDLRVHAELTRVAMEGEDVGSVVRTLSRLTNSVALVRTDDGRVTGSSSRTATEQLAARLDSCLRLAPPLAEGQDPVALAQADGTWVVIAPVRAVGVTFGHLALGLDLPLSRQDKLAAQQAAVVCALMLAREEAAVEAARRLQSEFAWDLLEGRLPDSVEAGVRARHLGAGFVLPARVVAIELHGLTDEATTAGWNPEHLERSRGACSSLILAEMAQAGVEGPVLARRADLFALVVPCARNEASGTGPRRLAQALGRITWPRSARATVGVSARVDRMAGFPDAWREARLAMSATGAGGEPGIFEELGVLQFLLAPTSRQDLDAFAQRSLGPLLDYDRAHCSELLRTLQVFLSTGSSTRRTAELISVHHRTVSYRVKRITELTGLHLDDTEDLLKAQLACKILGLGAQLGGDETAPGG